MVEQSKIGQIMSKLEQMQSKMEQIDIKLNQLSFVNRDIKKELVWNDDILAQMGSEILELRNKMNQNGDKIW